MDALLDNLSHSHTPFVAPYIIIYIALSSKADSMLVGARQLHWLMGKSGRREEHPLRRSMWGHLLVSAWLMFYEGPSDEVLELEAILPACQVVSWHRIIMTWGFLPDGWWVPQAARLLVVAGAPCTHRNYGSAQQPPPWLRVA